jgi:ribosomal protein S18 acetylase RimI-like enzyme
MYTLAQHLAHLAHLTVRASTSDDQAFLQQLYASTRDDLRHFPGGPALVASLITMQQNLQTAGYSQQFPDATHLIVAHQGAPVGRIITHVSHTAMRLVDIALLPAARKRGFGRAILQALQHSASAQNLPLSLRVNTNNPHAKRLYLAQGFQVCASDALADQMIWRDHADSADTAAIADHPTLPSAA